MKYFGKITIMICGLFIGFSVRAQTDGVSRSVNMEKAPPRSFEVRSANDTSNIQSVFPKRPPAATTTPTMAQPKAPAKTPSQDLPASVQPIHNDNSDPKPKN